MALTALLVTNPGMAETVNFDSDAIGSSPAGWTCRVTGSGSARWAVTADPSAPSKSNVLMQTGRGAFPWCVNKFKAICGREDQAGGVVWRWKNGDSYYVARANALENNVSLHYTEGGSRKTLKYVDAPVALGAWHTLRVDFAGSRVAVSLNGKRYIEVDDKRITGPGAVRVWTKADSVTAFDDFTFSAALP